MRKKYIFYVALIFFILNMAPAYSDTIKVSSEQLNVSRGDNISVFSGNAYAEDVDIKLWSDKISMFYDETKNSIYRIIAEGKVKIIVEGVTAYGNFSEYKVNNEELLLEGDVVVIENDNKIQSDKLILDLANSTSIMTSETNKRVTAEINKLNNEE